MKKYELYEVKENRSSEKIRSVCAAPTESSWLTMGTVRLWKMRITEWKGKIKNKYNFF
jgi:hypothetical protein